MYQLVRVFLSFNLEKPIYVHAHDIQLPYMQTTYVDYNKPLFPNIALPNRQFKYMTLYKFHLF